MFPSHDLSDSITLQLITRGRAMECDATLGNHLLRNMSSINFVLFCAVRGLRHNIPSQLAALAQLGQPHRGVPPQDLHAAP